MPTGESTARADYRKLQHGGARFDRDRSRGEFAQLLDDVFGFIEHGFPMGDRRCQRD